LVFWVAIFLCLLAGLFTAWYLTSYKSLVVTYKNAHDVKIYKTAALNSGKDKKPAAAIASSGQEVKLREGSYTLHYEGNDGYESRYVVVNVTQKHQKFSFAPDYSDSKLQAMLKAESPAIQQALKNTFPDIGLYEIQTGKLYDKGEWYGTALVYKGAYGPNSDMLRVVLHKENGSWIVKTVPPRITLSKFTYPDVPVDVLRDINSLPIPASSLSNDATDPGYHGARPR
jgi:hypothetical protein